MLDCGVKLNSTTQFPLAPPAAPHAIIVSHAHLDHSGNLPRVASDFHAPWICTPPTLPLVEMLLEDSLKIFQAKKTKPYYTSAEAARAAKKAACLGFEKEYEFFDGTTLKFFDAGHILGSAQSLLSFAGNSGKTLLYTGDIKLSETRLHKGAKIPNEHVDVLAMESTYSEKAHENRRELEKRFCRDVQEALDDGLPVLVPCFAIDRTQEIVEVLQNNNVKGEIYVDGMGQKVYDVMLEYPSYSKDFTGLKKSLKKSHFASEKNRKKLGGAPAIIVSTAGMLDGGPALTYLQRMNTLGRGKVFLTGFQVKGSNGRMLLDEGAIRIWGAKEKISIEARHYDFSGHADDAELVGYAKRLNPGKIFCMHGEEQMCIALAAKLRDEHGFDAVAPTNGDVFDI